MVRLHWRLPKTHCLPFSVVYTHHPTPHTFSMHIIRLIITSTNLELKHISIFSYSQLALILIHYPSIPSSSFLPILPHSDHSFGYGGHDQHDKRLDREPSEVCPFPRCHSVSCIQRGQPWRTDPHLDRGGLPALQLPVSCFWFTPVLTRCVPALRSC